jgi:hypothetical protein
MLNLAASIKYVADVKALIPFAKFPGSLTNRRLIIKAKAHTLITGIR